MSGEPSIQTLLTIGENIAIEFKRAGNGPERDTYETICAFLNRQGGDVLLGVENDGTVVGVPSATAPSMVKQIVNAMNDPNLWEPRFAVYPEIVRYGGKTLIRIHVPAGPDVYWFKGKCYDRVNEADVVVRGTSPIADMFIRKREIYTEQRVFPFVTKADLRLDLLPSVRSMAQAAHNGTHPWMSADDDALLRSAKLLGTDAATGKEGFNAAAVLLLGTDDTIGSCFPAYKTDALLRRVNVDRYDDRVTVYTNLIEAFDRLMAFGEKHLDDKFYLEDVQRVGIRNKILREMIVNLLVHREFTSAFAARFVIERTRVFTENANKAINPGIITQANLRPYSKNPIIAKFFHEIGRADELGSGVRNLYRYVKLYSGADPIFDEGDIFRLTVPLDAEHSPERMSFPPEKVSVEPEKVSVEPEKVSVEPEKVSVDRGVFARFLDAIEVTRPTRQNIMTVFEHVGGEPFGRAQIVACTNMGTTGAGKLINAMLRLGLLISVTGHGKGRYRFAPRISARPLSSTTQGGD